MDNLQEILEAIDMEWLLDREGVNFRESHGRSGRQLNVKTCPHCGNQNWKVYLNADTGLGNCFAGSCSKPTFNKWAFLSALYGQSGRELIQLLKSLAQEIGWRPKRPPPVFAPPDLSRLELPESMPVALMPHVPEYLMRRGVTADVASYFDLRYSAHGTYPYVSPKGERLTQDYSNRIIIPVRDLDGTTVTFQGRDASGTAAKRYIFPPMLAASGAYLYNGFHWSESMDTVVIAEGVFDVIGIKRALDAIGWSNVLPVGTFGMHLSGNSPVADDQMGRLRQLKQRGLKRVIFLWDGEYKAVRAACEAAVGLRGIGLDPHVALLPLNRDPGEATIPEIHTALLNAQPASSKLDLLKILQKAKQSLGNS